MSDITRSGIEHLARLARLALNENEIEQFSEQLNAIMDHFSAIKKVDTEGIPPTIHPAGITNVEREDIVRKGLTPQQALNMAPIAEDNRFKVPQILGEE